MIRRILATGLLAVICAAGTRVLDGAAPAANVAASAVFGMTGTILGDGDGASPYAENIDCVRSWFSPAGGNYYFRTASNTFCDYQSDGTIFSPPFATQRHVLLDFGQRLTPLAQCEIADGHDHILNACEQNSIPDLRLIADSLFKSRTLNTPVTIHFDLYPNFVNDTAFMLQFLQPVSVSVLPSGAHQLEATSAIAELSLRTTGKRPKLVPIAQYNMSFSMTVTPCPTNGCP